LVVFFPTSKNLCSILSGYKAPAGTRVKLCLSRGRQANELRGSLRIEIESEDSCFRADSHNLSIPTPNRVPLCSNYDEVCSASNPGDGDDDHNDVTIWANLKKFATLIQACEVLGSEQVAFGEFPR
jgi:hypothetical protein